jgi:isoleucyl-tRNA synthetase
VHPELTYVALRPSDEIHPTRYTIVAKDRMEALEDILGHSEIIVEFHGDVQHATVAHDTY